METITLNVSGMRCGGCSSTIKQKLENTIGIATADADHTNGKVNIAYDSEKMDVETLKNIIADAGYNAE